jgi:hypothetical protein
LVVRADVATQRARARSAEGRACLAAGRLAHPDGSRRTGAELASALKGRGERCVRAVAGERYARIEPGLYSLDAPTLEATGRCWRRRSARSSRVVGWCICGGWTRRPGGDHGGDAGERPARRELERAVPGAGAAAAGLSGHAAAVAGDAGAQAVGEAEDVAVAQAPLWGLGRTLALEHPELGCTRWT